MAHFVYFVGHTDPIPNGHVPDSTEYTLLWDQIVASINGDDGGTWSPTDPIIIGGDGLSLDGTAHEIAASSRLTVQNTGEIVVADGGLLRLDGTSGANIDLKVTSGVPLIDVESGGAIRIKSGGALEVYGGLTFKQTGGPGSATWESGTSATWSSGATLTAASGSTVNLTGDTLVRGTLTIRASGGPGSFVREAGTTATSNGATTIGTTATETWLEGATINGIVTRAGSEIRSGTTARTMYRAAYDLPNADADCTVEYDRYNVPVSITASRTYTVKHTGSPTPRVGERIRFTRAGLAHPTPGNSVSIEREDGTVIWLFGAEQQGFCEVEWDGSNWIWIAGYKASVGTSGIYNDVWT